MSKMPEHLTRTQVLLQSKRGREKLVEHLAEYQLKNPREFFRLRHEIAIEGYEIVWDKHTDRPLQIFKIVTPEPDLPTDPLPFDFLK